MEEMKKRNLELMSCRIRRTALDTIRTAGSGHIGGSFSIAEILSVLYFDKMRVDPSDPERPDRDRFVISKGHCSPAVYTALALRGFFPVEHLKTFREITSDLSGHVEMHVPGVDMSTGSLGQGLSAALGMAMYGVRKGYDNRIYCVLGDGEIQEGQVWEAAMAAGHYKADNLIAMIDNNGLQLDGTLEEVMSPYPIDDKLRAFGWHVMTVDGHDVEQLAAALDLAAELKGKPVMIVAETVKGKGVSVFENQVRFHGGHPTKEEFETAYAELDKKIAELEG